jgi:PAS domain S-box-containing protein
MVLSRRAAQWMAFAVAALGAIVLVGWVMDIAALRSIFPVPVAMRASAALGVGLCGAAMALLSGQRVTEPIRLGASLVAAVVIVLGTTALAEEIFGWDLGFEGKLLGAIAGLGNPSGPTRVSPPTAFCFVLTGIAIAVASCPIPRRFRLPLLSGLGATLVVIGGMSLLGHISENLLGLHALNYIRMAAYTAGAFALLGGSLLALARSEGGLEWSLDSFTTGGFALGIYALLIVAPTSHSLIEHMQEVTAQVGRSEEALKEIEELIAGMVSLNSGQRGYIITGDEHLLLQRQTIIAALREDLEATGKLVRSQPDQVRRLDEVALLIDQRTEWENRTIAARGEHGFAAAQQLVAGGEGMALNEQIDTIFKAMEDQEYTLLEQRRKHADAVAKKTFLLLPVGVFVSLTFLSLGFFILNAGIGERKRTENALKESEALFHRTFDSMLEGCQIIGFDWRYVYVNSSITRQCRRTREELLGHTMMAVFPGIEETEMFGALRRCMEKRIPQRMENRFEHEDGTHAWFDLSIQAVPEGILVVSFDITERRDEAAKLRESDLRFRQLAENVKEVFWLTDPAKNEMLYVSPAYDEIWGRKSEDLYSSSLDWVNAIHPEDRDRVLEAARTKQLRGDYLEEFRIVRPDGSIRWISDKAFPIKDHEGRIFRIAGVAEDITTQRRVQDELKESERRFSDMLRNVELISMMLDCDARITYCNDYLLRLTGWQREEVIGRNWFELFVPPDLYQAKATFAALLKDLPIAWHFESEILTKSGDRRLVRWNNSVLRSPTQEVVGSASIGEDVTARNKAAEVQARMAAIVESSDDAIIGKDVNGLVTSWNAGATRIFGYTPDEMVGRPIVRLLPPERADEGQQILRRVKAGENVEHSETTRVRKNGELVDVSITVSPIKDAGGNVVGASKIARDISGRKELEDRLRQSEKMEAIGQLTGGVAHDFNNLLGVILGNLDLLERLVVDNELASKRVHIAQKAASRGADLTRRMLAFSSRQPLHPAPISVAESVENTIEMAARALGPEITITTNLDRTIPAVYADAAGLENALLNLVVNARDAMPLGGSISISSCLADFDEDNVPVRLDELKPGHYARILVSDTGHGMTPETLERVFEPFFTTKARSKGTGLGLAMVYGFVKQSGGTVRIYSEPSHGTTVSLYLPLADHVQLQPKPVLKQILQDKVGGVVLVVDDEVDLLEVAVAYLEDMGYQVFHATDGNSALRVIESESAIDLLVTDVIMPGGMNGVQLAQKAMLRRPGIKIVYSSGFPSSALNERGGTRVEGPLLYKPFRRDDFVATIRRAMAATPEPIEAAGLGERG